MSKNTLKLRSLLSLALISIVVMSCKKESLLNSTTVPNNIVEGSYTDERDGHIYKTIQIGRQTWMAENLQYRIPQGSFANCLTIGENFLKLSDVTIDKEKFKVIIQKAIADGKFDNVPDGEGFDFAYFKRAYLDRPDRTLDDFFDQWFPPFLLGSIPPYEPIIRALYDEVLQDAIPQYALAGADLSSAKKYGYLYSYNAAKKAVPAGWHIATDQDWLTLEKTLGITNDELKKMEAWRGSDQGKQLMKNKALKGFIENLAGLRIYGSKPTSAQTYYYYQDISTYFWTSTMTEASVTDTTYIIRKISTLNNGIFRGTEASNDKHNGAYLSVRCVKNL